MARFVWGTRSRRRLRPAASPRVEAGAHASGEDAGLPIDRHYLQSAQAVLKPVPGTAVGADRTSRVTARKRTIPPGDGKEFCFTLVIDDRGRLQALPLLARC